MAGGATRRLLARKAEKYNGNSCLYTNDDYLMNVLEI
jgi:hypothetical protein